MAQQTFSGVPAEFTAGEVLSSSDQNLLRDFLIALIKEGMTGDTGEILPMIMDLTNNRIVLDTGGLEFSNGSTQTIAAAAGLSWSGSTANGLGTYSSSSEIVAESTATYDGTTLALTQSGGGIQLDGLSSSSATVLDSYEEGTWTAAISTGGGSITPAAEDTMNYTKIGRLVNVSGSVDGFSVSSPTGAMSVTGLPFAIADTAEKSDRGSCAVTANGLASAEDNIMGQFNAGGGVVINYGNGATDGGGAHMATLIDAGSYIRINATYVAAT